MSYGEVRLILSKSVTYSIKIAPGFYDHLKKGTPHLIQEMELSEGPFFSFFTLDPLLFLPYSFSFSRFYDLPPI
jgi:hypothetical protein